MYPFVRLARELFVQSRAPRLGLLDAHVSSHVCWPWDLDPWVELNNGRTLTLYDLGRIPYARRIGLDRVLAQQGWGMTVAGVSVRYRRRIRAFERFRMVTRCHGWDDRFIYLDQSMWRGSDCANHMLLRSAVTGPGGIVPPARMIEALGTDTASPALPGWVRAWVEADACRPWPPESLHHL